MRTLRTLLYALVALALTSPLAIAAEPTPEEIAQTCITHIAQVRHNTVHAIGQRTQVGVAQIAYLADHGAPPEALIHSAEISRHSVNAIAMSGKNTVIQIAYICLTTLEELDAPEAIRQAVINARHQALAVIGQARHEGLVLIDEALAHALDKPRAVRVF